MIRTVAVLLALLASVQTLKFSLTLPAEETRCFYQMLATQEKYAIEVTPLSQVPYQLAIKHQQDGEWLHSVARTAEASQNITLHKLASKEALYSFCLTNSAADPLKAKVSIRWGIQLHDLALLADQTDQQLLLREAKWIDKHADKIIEGINSAKQQLAIKQQLQNMMGYKLLGFACIGILTVLLLNGSFYFSLRKTFRQRKMI